LPCRSLPKAGHTVARQRPGEGDSDLAWRRRAARILTKNSKKLLTRFLVPDYNDREPKTPSKKKSKVSPKNFLTRVTPLQANFRSRPNFTYEKEIHFTISACPP
jgi:hypothetical protein